MVSIIRNFKKQKTVSILGMLSLSLGTMVAILIGLWTINEYSYDNFHRNSDRIYRAVTNGVFNGRAMKIGAHHRPFAEEAAGRFPEIERMLRVSKLTLEELKTSDRQYDGIQICMADSNFFSFFSFPLLEGVASDVLSSPNGAVVDEATAQKLFPGQSAVGQNITIEEQEFTITGIMRMPSNSHLQASVIVPFFGWHKETTWENNNGYLTYFLLPPNANTAQLQQKLTDLMLERAPIFKDYQATIELEPLSSIHFSEGTYGYDPALKGNKRLLITLALVAMVVLLLACINFTNLFVSVAFLRTKEVGIKKSQGANIETLSGEFYLETGLYVAFAIVLGLVLAWAITPYFNQYVDTGLYIDFASPKLYAFLLTLFFFTTLMAGSLPAFQISHLSLLAALKGTYRAKQISFAQKSLLIVQFTASIALLLVTLSINRQVDFMLSRDLGFDRKNVLYAWSRDDFGKNFETLRNELLQEPSIQNVSMSDVLPTKLTVPVQYRYAESNDNQTSSMLITRVKDSYFDVLGMHFIAGNNPFTTTGSDSLNYCVINEAAARYLGFKDPLDAIDKTLVTENASFMSPASMVVKGVVHDAQVRSFHQSIEPQAYIKQVQQWDHCPLMFKIEGDPKKAIAAIAAQWDRNVKDAPFEYHFLDKDYEQLYTAETNLRSVLSIAMLVSFIISVAGLFAMAFYSTQRRIKEVALRKVNGATMASLLVLLNRDFMVWVGTSMVLASALTYVFMKEYWLKGFVVQASLSIGIFIAVGLMAAFITLLTVSWQTYKAANTNPVKVIKNE